MFNIQVFANKMDGLLGGWATPGWPTDRLAWQPASWPGKHDWWNTFKCHSCRSIKHTATHLLAKGYRSSSPDVYVKPHLCPKGSLWQLGPLQSWMGRHWSPPHLSNVYTCMRYTKVPLLLLDIWCLKKCEINKTCNMQFLWERNEWTKHFSPRRFLFLHDEMTYNQTHPYPISLSLSFLIKSIEMIHSTAIAFLLTNFYM